MIDTCMALWNRITCGSGARIGLACIFLTSMFFGVTLVIGYSVLSWQSALPSQASGQSNQVAVLARTPALSPDPAVTVILTPNSADPIQPGVPAPIVAQTPVVNPVLTGGYASPDQSVIMYPSTSQYYPQQSIVRTRSSAAVPSRTTHQSQPRSTPATVKPTPTPTLPAPTPTPVVPVTTPTPKVPVVTPTLTPPLTAPTPVPVLPTQAPVESTPQPQPRSTVLPVPVMTPDPALPASSLGGDTISSPLKDTKAPGA